MSKCLQIGDLTFPSFVYGERETPWDLRILLYFGAALARRDQARKLIDEGKFGKPLEERIELVQRIHEAIDGKLVGGGAQTTANAKIEMIRRFFSWAEEFGHHLTLEEVQATYLHWTDWLLHRQRVIRDLTAKVAFGMGARIGGVLDVVLDRSTPLVKISRLSKKNLRKTAGGIQAEKQNLEDTFEFGHLLQDICDGLSADVVMHGALPVRIPLRRGGELVEWSRWGRPSYRLSNHESCLDTPQKRQTKNRSDKRFAAWEAEGTLRTRSPLANLRILAEILMFIGQTSINLGQAYRLTLRDFVYVSHLDGYLVKDRKGRRQGEVIFEIYKEYKPHFERYLSWRRALFPESNLLFPLVSSSRRSEFKPPNFGRILKISENLNIKYISPSLLRNTRVNWMLRRSGDPELTAEMAQHTVETLLKVYERPSLQRAVSEITRFWQKNDPALSKVLATAPGECDGRPSPSPDTPNDAAPVDCIHASGCLWCTHHRDIDSQDYVWALGSFRHLKIIEVSKWCPPHRTTEKHPAEHAIEVLSNKLQWFKESGEKRLAWVEEALMRIEEGCYHPDWRYLIESVEGGAS